jgi:hypothetical protein
VEQVTKLRVVTAMIDPEKTKHLWGSWRANSEGWPWTGHVVVNGAPQTGEQLRELMELAKGGTLSAVHHPLSVLPAFYLAFSKMSVSAFHKDPVTYREERLEGGGDIIALLHDDLRIDEPRWAEKVIEFFDTHPEAVLAGFGGAYGIGAPGMYDRPFDPMTLARHGFISNMEHAEAHGSRALTARPVAVLDGFSLIGRGWFVKQALDNLQKMEVMHHAYDAYFGMLARKMGKQVWFLPFRCHHHGGMSAVASASYNEWAKTQDPQGDQGFWLKSHRQVWEAGRGLLPFDVREEPRGE